MNNVDYTIATYTCSTCEQIFRPSNLFNIRKICPDCSRAKRRANTIKLSLILYFFFGLSAILTAFGMGIQVLLPG